MTLTEWVIEVQGGVGNISAQEEQWKRRSIYQLHPHITSLNEEAFRPKLVSFGPYHHEEEHLKQMEEHKKRALKQFLMRSNQPAQTLVDSLSQVVDELKNSYDPLAPEWGDNNDRFLKMMILDGCFMLEILRLAADAVDDYSRNDPIFGRHRNPCVLPLLGTDMLMIENQLPMLVLDTMLAVEGKPKKKETAKKLIVKFLCPPETRSSKLGKCLHVLDLYRKNLLLEPGYKPYPYPGRYIVEDGYTSSATSLVESGIVLRMSKTSSLRDITFRKGVLKLPAITVDSTTESILLNLMAFERYHTGAGQDVTSYIFFMKAILDADTERDVALLMQERIIQNPYGSNKDVVDLFKRLSRYSSFNADREPVYGLAAVHDELNKYRNERWNQWLTTLRHAYFGNPWVTISVIGAMSIFVLTLMQTIFSGLPGHK